MTGLCAFHGMAGGLFASRSGPPSIVDHAHTTADHDGLVMTLLAAAAIVIVAFVFAARHMRVEPHMGDGGRERARP
jgi:hypothetical protein